MRLRIPSYVPEGLLLFAIVFGPLAFGAVEVWARSILEFDLFLLFALCTLRPNTGSPNPMTKTVIPAVFALLVIGALQAANPRALQNPATVLPFTVCRRSTVQTLLLWASYAGLLWSSPRVLTNRKAQQRFVWALFGVGAIVAMVGIAQLGQGNRAYYLVRPVRQGLPFGPYVDRDHAGSMLVMSLIMGAGLFISRWYRVRKTEGFGKKSDLAATQVLLAFVLGIVAFGLMLTHSRGADLSFVCSIWIVAMLLTNFVGGRKVRWAIRGALALALPAYGYFLFSHPVYIGYIFGTPDISTAYRLSMYRSSLLMFRDFPLWGTGIGAVQQSFAFYREPFIERLVDHVHSDWLELALQAGLVGVGALVCGLGAFLILVVRAFEREVSRTKRFLMAGGLGAVIAFLIHEAIDFSFQIPANAVIFCALLGFLAALSSGDRSEAVETSGSISRPEQWRIVMAFGITVLAILSLRPAAAWWELHESYEVPEARRQNYWQRALFWDDDPDLHFRIGAMVLTQADAASTNRATLLRRALSEAQAAYSAEPLSPRYNYLLGAVLWRLGRVAEADALITNSHLLGG